MSLKLYQRVRKLSAEAFTQNLWFLAPMTPDHIGYGRGLLTASRLRRHRQLRRQIHITLLEFHAGKPRFGPLTTFWINERSRLCSASLNERVEEADVVWIYTQDPVTAELHERLLKAIGKARPGARIINHPDVYNAYHQDHCFQHLAAAGVNVPEDIFSERDFGRTKVVYKTQGCQGAPKTLVDFEGPKRGFKAFRFIDSRGADGHYRRYRVDYIAGIVRVGTLMLCDHWNVCLKHDPHLEFTFAMTAEEVRQIRQIARALGLDYFAVDYLRQSGDDKPFFTDVNVYPAITSLATTARHLGYHGAWHTFDARGRLGIEEPGGRPFHEIFDEGMLHFVSGKRR